MAQPNRQNGNTLVTSLVMLTLLTLVAVSALNMSSTNLQVVGNMQFHTEATVAAEQAIERVISRELYLDDPFTDSPPADDPVDIDGDGNDDYTVTFAPAPSCLWYQSVDLDADTLPSDCYGGSSLGDIDLCYWTVWDVAATATDVNTGASATVHQGVRVLTGLNGALAYCGAGA